MKRFILLFTLICIGFSVQKVYAQNPVATLEHGGATKIFYGLNSLVEACNASVNGDFIYLSTGYFTSPVSIAKGVKIIGAGHYPDSVTIAKRTFIMGSLSIMKGADSLRLEGLYFNGDLTYDYNNNSVDYVKAIRCRLSSVHLYSNTSSSCKKNCSFEECFIPGYLSGDGNVANLCIKNSIVGTICNISGSSVIINNLILVNINQINTSIIQNNIIKTVDIYSFGSGNSINNNIFASSPSGSETNFFSNNYTGVTLTDIFVNQSGTAIDYTQDYHLKNPATYIGTDGTQVGLYGGSTPFKDKGVPSNPQITSVKVDNATDKNGKLTISITVQAQ